MLEKGVILKLTANDKIRLIVSFYFFKYHDDALF